MNEDYRVQLDVFTGPLDLLLYLIKRDELDIQDIPLARLTEQYLEYAHLLEQLDPNSAGDFLVMASTLVELKSRALLPTPPLEAEDDDGDPRTMLVKQLLEYKRFKDAALALGTSADDRAKRYVRKPANLPKELEGVELEEAQVWDLLKAFGRVMSAIGQGAGRHEVTYDDTPIEEFKSYLLDAVETRGTLKLQSLWDGRSNRAEIVGMFLALLELIRSRRIRAEQNPSSGDIYLFQLVAATDDEEENSINDPAIDDDDIAIDAPDSELLEETDLTVEPEETDESESPEDSAASSEYYRAAESTLLDGVDFPEESDQADEPEPTPDDAPASPAATKQTEPDEALEKNDEHA